MSSIANDKARRYFDAKGEDLSDVNIIPRYVLGNEVSGVLVADSGSPEPFENSSTV